MGARRILIIDDCADTVELVASLLTSLGHECHGVSSGEAALVAGPQFSPEIVLLDLSLPDLSGYHVARELRTRCRDAFYLAALTGWGSARDVERTRESGFDQHLVKPVNARALRGMIDRASTQLR
jgi:DNA-binding response OmpR family regulator